MLTEQLIMQGSAKGAPKLFNPAEEYDEKSVLVVTLAHKTITLTAKEVTGMPWPQFVRLMKVRSSDVPHLMCPCSNVPHLRLLRHSSSWNSVS